MAPIQARHQISHMSVHVALVFLAGVLLGAVLLGAVGSAGQILGTAFFSAWALAAFWAKSVQGRRRVDIDVAGQQVSTHEVSAFFSPEMASYPLDGFGSVRSYITIERFARNRVELVTKAGGEALLVASFQPRNGATSFWSMPTEAEHPEAAALRQKIAACAGLRDQGFLGPRMVGAQLVASTRPHP